MKDLPRPRRGVKGLQTLRIPGFGRLATASLVNELGNWLGEIALAIVVFDQTGSPVAVAALFVAMQFVPAVATPPLVARLDSLHSRGALPLLYFSEAVAFAVLAVLAGDDTFVLAAVLAVAAVDGTLATAARARTRAAAAAILGPRELLREGNGILNIGFTAGAAIGPALAGLLVATAGAQTALLADSASFLAVGLLLATSGALPAAHGDETGGWFARMRRGMTYVRERVALQRLMAAEGVAFVFFALVLPIEVAFAKDTLDAGDFGYGLLLAAWGVGMVVGSIVFSSLRDTPLTTLLIGGTFAIGVAYAATGVAPSLAVACAASVVGGAGNGVQWVAVVTAVQNLTAGPYQARVIGLLESLASGLSGVGFLLGGVIAATLSPRASYVVAGLGVLIVLALAIIALRGVRWERDARAAADARPEVGAIPAG
jgi:MFS family permease